MQLFKINILESALNDITKISLDVYTISRDFDLTKNYVDYIFSVIHSLSFLPKRNPLNPKGYCFIKAKKYTIFYKVSEEKKEVLVYNVLLSSRDLLSMFE